MSLIYFLLWVIFNGRITFEIIIFGIIISLLLDIFVRKVIGLNLTGRKLLQFLKIFPDALFYGIVLLIEIIKANILISRIILAPEIRVEPCIIKFRTPLKTQAARIALANSITLTPGAITISLNENELLVHALDREIAKELENNIFERLLARMEARFDA